MNIRDIDLNLLVVFEAIFSAGNISKAAEQLDISQPALSNALARLRKQLDDPLFVRRGNGVVPTARAEEMIDPVREALAAIQRSIEPASEFDPATTSRHFKLMIADPLEPITVPALLRQTGRHSNLTYELQPPQAVNIEEALLSGKFELALFLAPERNPDLCIEPLCPLDHVLLARKDHPRIQGPVTIDELKQESHVSLNLTPGKLANAEKVTFWQRLLPHVSIQVHKMSSVVQIVSQSELIGLVPRIYAHHAARMLNLQIQEWPTEVSNQKFQMIWHKRYEADAGHQWLRHHAQESVMAAYQLALSEKG